MRTIHVNASAPYDIYIEKGLLFRSGECIRQLSNARKAVIITDDIVEKLYAHTLKSELEAAGFTVVIFSFDNGEQSKSHKVLLQLYEYLCEKEITRKDLLIALGGGVVGDLTGFCAATYLRGVEFIQIPTTLLAQIDSSVGGKTGVNIEAGKNLVGAFKQPLLVLCDVDTLSSLPDETFYDGVAEAVKYGAIRSQGLFKTLLQEDIQEHLLDVIYECIDIKRQVVESDEFDLGERMLLNFGHTLGHAIEKYFGYGTYSHGKAVAIGMAVLTRLSEQYGITEAGTSCTLEKCLRRYHLPTTVDMPVDSLVSYSANDKKRSKDMLHLILLRCIGDSFIYPLPLPEFQEFIKGEYKP